MIHSTTLRGLATPLVTLLLSFAVLAIGCVPDSRNPADGNDGDPNNADGNGNGDGQGDSNGDSSGFTLAEKIDPHITILAQQLLAEGGDAAVLAWPGETLLPEDYDGAMRATSGVLAGFMGNDLDRCRLVRELLSAANIANRFALNGESCMIEALVDNEPLHVPTSRFDEGPIPDDWGRPMSIPAASFHAIEIVESYCATVFSSVECAPIEHSLGTWTLAELASAPVIADYVDDADGLRLRIRTGRRGDREESFGVVGEDANRLDLIFRYTRPTQEPVEYRRILFDGPSTIMNQSPDVGVDVYAIWFGANVVSERYLDVENALADLAEDDAETGEVLYLRAIELAMETDNAAWQLFDTTGLDGGAFFDGARIVIAAQERRYDGHDGITPSFDLLSNSRRIRESTDPVAASFALGYVDAMVEGAVLERSTGSPGVVVPDIFAGLFQEEADDVVSRAEMFESALSRLEDEGVTEEALVFLDETSGATVQITLIGNDLLLVLDDEDIDRLEIIARELFDELLATVDGVVLGEGSERSWPIDLLLMDKGAAVNYRVRIEHIESPQLALATPTGTHIQGSGTYLGQSFRIRGISRRFEQTDVDSGTDEKRDRSDWHLFDETGSLIGSGATDRPTAELDEYNPRILQWGKDPSTISFYESPLWVAPALAAGIRSRIETESRITTDTGGASDWIAVTLTEFSDSRMTVTIDEQPVGIQTIVATDAANEYEIVIAKHGLTRTILGLRTPNGEAVIDSFVTPRSLRLRGRIVSKREPIGFAGALSYSVGVGNASISSGGLIGTSWPDGTVDLRVADTAQPTLRGGIGILVDTSNSMGEPADADCIDACTPKIEVVSDALADIIGQTEEGVELAVWGFPTTLEDGCLQEVRELAGWSLSREATTTARNSLGEAYLTGGTPLTGAVTAALDAMDGEAWGISRRLIILADGDNDCDLGLDTVTAPEGIEIHAIGVGLTEGGDAELALIDLAERGGGTYTRTTTGADLSDALTSIAALPLAPPVADVVSAEISAEDYTTASVEFPVDQDDVLVYLDESPGKETPAFMVIQPGEALPREDVAIDDETVALIEEHRAARPGITIVMPDRSVGVGGWPGAFGWLEIDADTGETTAVTSDGLHGAGGVIYLGATVVGLWAGADAVITNFSGCILSGEGCGNDLAQIRETICATTGYGPALGAIAISWLGTVFTAANGFALDQSFSNGLSVVNALCSTEFDLTDYVASVRDNAVSDGLSEVPGGWVGFGYTVMLTAWNNSGG